MFLRLTQIVSLESGDSLTYKKNMNFSYKISIKLFSEQHITVNTKQCLD